jgi:CDP-paratose 2-epimerase
MESGKSRNILITGGAGFIGSNLADKLLRQPRTHVRIFDNLSRAGVAHNLKWLQSIAPAGRFEFVLGDVRDQSSVDDAARDVTEIYHLAAQVAVTTSIDDPRLDFEINARGTLNMLEAARHSGRKPLVLFTSTNKVYGSLEALRVVADVTHYLVLDRAFKGVNEQQSLDFHSPYGCSKGAADQYVRDYGRIYGLHTVVFRMSCIAGPRQFGNEDQGWVAHFLYSALENRPVSVYGNGLQVRDVLHVSDLTDAMASVSNAAARSHGHVYNLGGAMERSVSVLEMLRLIEEKTGRPFECHHGEVRPGDQPLYISDTSNLTAHTGWRPQRTLDQILEDIHEFWHSNRQQIAGVREPVDASVFSGEVA